MRSSMIVWLHIPLCKFNRAALEFCANSNWVVHVLESLPLRRLLPCSLLQELDSQEFEVKPYLTKLVENTRLVGLISQHRDLSSQIKKLDSSMQQLIFENYNKFITATDEVRYHWPPFQHKPDFVVLEVRLLLIPTLSHCLLPLSHPIKPVLFTI